MTGGITVTAHAGLSTGVGTHLANRLDRTCKRCGAKFVVATDEEVCRTCARGA